MFLLVWMTLRQLRDRQQVTGGLEHRDTLSVRTSRSLGLYPSFFYRFSSFVLCLWPGPALTSWIPHSLIASLPNKVVLAEVV